MGNKWKNLNLRFLGDDEDGSDIGVTTDTDAVDEDFEDSGLEEFRQQQEDAQQTSAPAGGNDAPINNPTLNAFFSKLVGGEDDPDGGIIPQSLRTLLFEQTIKPELEKWQRGVDTQFDAFAPYKPLVDSGVPMEYLDAAVTLTQSVQNDPQQALRDLAEFVQNQGMDPATILGLAQAVQEDQQQQQQTDEFDLNDDLSKNPQFIEMQQRLQQQQQFLEQQQQAQLSAQNQQRYTSEIDRSLSEIQGSIGNRAFDRNAIIERAQLIQAQVPAEEEIDTRALMRAAYQSWFNDRAEIAKTLRRAPRISGGTSRGGGQQPEAQKPKTDEERRQMIVALAERHARGEDM